MITFSYPTASDMGMLNDDSCLSRVKIEGLHTTKAETEASVCVICLKKNVLDLI